ncbi:MAG: methyltransferase domain-containing protein [Gammaproteobacteria bacterium]|nr:methyltransferase domain-containing protein [Gammaproteobacteria bacterium]
MQTMKETTEMNWSRYWTGRTAAATGEALAGARIEHDRALARFWQSVFAEAPGEARIIDLACGAGSALKAAQAAGLASLTGVDVSADAISALEAAIPGSRGVVASACETGLDEGSFDFVVSQFGFEYAGAMAAAREAIRLAAPGAQFIAIAHKEASPIGDECRANLARTDAIIETGFVAAARELFAAVYSGRADSFERAASRFRAPQDRLAALCRNDAAHRNGLAGHLYAGTQRLYERRAAYRLDDITGWLDGMEAEIMAYAGRMNSMLEAALDEETAGQVLREFERAGWSAGAAKEFCLDDDNRPVAWQLSATAS